MSTSISDAVWRTSSRSDNGHCVELAHVTGGVALRDSKDRGGPVLRFSEADWSRFLAGLHTDQPQL